MCMCIFNTSVETYSFDFNTSTLLFSSSVNADIIPPGFFLKATYTHVLLFSSRVQQPPQQPSLCPLGSPRTNSSSPAKVTQLQTWIRASDCLEVLWYFSSRKTSSQASCVSRPLRSDPAGGARCQRGSVHHPAASAADPPAATDAAWRRAGTCHTTGNRLEVLEKRALKCSMTVGIVGPHDASLFSLFFSPKFIFFLFFMLLDFVKTFSANLYL